MTDLEKLLFVADTQLNVTEVPPGSNGGLKVEEYQALVGLKKGDPWCAAFVNWCGNKALGERWPLPRVGGCATLGAWGKRERKLVDSPQPGDVFLLYFPSLTRFAHTGFVIREAASGNGGAYETIEGNTSGAGSREGWGVFRRIRTFGPQDRFIRWAP